MAQAKIVRSFLSCMTLRGQADVGLGFWKVGEVLEDTIVQRYLLPLALLANSLTGARPKVCGGVR